MSTASRAMFTIDQRVVRADVHRALPRGPLQLHRRVDPLLHADTGYSGLLTDAYPPFDTRASTPSTRSGCRSPRPRSPTAALKVFFRCCPGIPVMLINYALNILVQVCTLFSLDRDRGHGQAEPRACRTPTNLATGLRRSRGRPTTPDREDWPPFNVEDNRPRAAGRHRLACGAQRAGPSGALLADGPMSPDIHSFAIGFDQRDRARLHALWDEVHRLRPLVARAPMNRALRGRPGRPATASPPSRSAAGPAAPLAALDFAGVQRRDRARARPTPSWPRRCAISRAGGAGQFVDCNREDLCMSFEDFERKAAEHKPKARACSSTSAATSPSTSSGSPTLLPRADGHLPDRGLRARPRRRAGTARRPGTYGDAGVYSFYATKTVSTGEGGVLVSRHPELIEHARAVPQLRQARLRGRRPELPHERVHRRDRRWSRPSGSTRSWPGRTTSRASELDPVHPGRLQLPDGMVSGLYKYIVFDQIERSTGKVYDEPCHRIMGHGVDLPNSDWVAEQPLVRPALLPARGGHRRPR